MRPKALERLVLIAVMFAVTVPPATSDEASESAITREHQLKAAYLFNFAKFVKWPTDKNDDSLNFCMVGYTPIGPALERFMAGKRIQGKTPKIRHAANINQTNDCHVLFISQTEQSATARLAETIRNSSVLTVGETADFAEHGGIIEFTVVANKLRFAVNLEAARRARLVLSSKLLKLAQAVRRDQ